MKHLLQSWRSLLLAVLFVGTMVTFSSCGDDEPKGSDVVYYLDVEEAFHINGSISQTDRFQSPITRMQEAINKAYPKPTAQGDDAAVIAACDNEYATYVQMYSYSQEHFTCVFSLVKGMRENGIIKKSETLKVYSYDINAAEIEEDD